MKPNDSIAKSVESIIRNNRYYNTLFFDADIEKYVKIVNRHVNRKNIDGVHLFRDFGPILLVDMFKLIYPMIPDHLKFKTVVRVYSLAAQDWANLKDELVDAKKFRADNHIAPLREKVSNNNTFTIYRGVANYKEINPHLSLSWTIDEEIAKSYARIIQKSKVGYVYSATINIDDVIAYVTDRYENEVIQYNGVYDIKVSKV